MPIIGFSTEFLVDVMTVWHCGFGGLVSLL